MVDHPTGGWGGQTPRGGGGGVKPPAGEHGGVGPPPRGGVRGRRVFGGPIVGLRVEFFLAAWSMPLIVASAAQGHQIVHIEPAGWCISNGDDVVDILSWLAATLFPAIMAQWVICPESL